MRRSPRSSQCRQYPSVPPDPSPLSCGEWIPNASSGVLALEALGSSLGEELSQSFESSLSD